MDHNNNALGEITIVESMDIPTLGPFYIEQGLEFDEDGRYEKDELVRCWEARGADGALLGACTLAMREGEFICDGIATVPEVRGQRLGSRLIGLLLDEAKRRGAARLFLVARAPGFFKTLGFTSVDRADAPEFFECFSCPQYQVNCFPEAMRKDLL